MSFRTDSFLTFLVSIFKNIDSDIFVELRVELGPGCHAQSRFSRTVLFNGVYYCNSVKMMESKLIYQRMNIGYTRL